MWDPASIRTCQNCQFSVFFMASVHLVNGDLASDVVVAVAVVVNFIIIYYFYCYYLVFF